ncbi:MAG: PEGA domain-containing protein [Myxococcales bacterium]|nr:PEGA domain-containing protein [Myxococcales bacterium]
MKTSRITSFLATVAIVAAAPLASAQRLVQANVQSTPSGATVRVDSATAAPVGVTPLPRARLPLGQHRLFFTLDGYVPGTLDVTVATRNRTAFTTSLVQAGSVYVAADIDGAPIFLDGNQVGTTPGRVNGLTPGQHIVEIRAADMQPFRETVTVNSGAVASVSANLRPRQAPTGTVRVVLSNPNGPVPADTQVTLDGSPMQGTPPTTEGVQPGTHIVAVSATGFRTMRREVVVVAGQAQVTAFDLEPAAATGGTVRVVIPSVQGAQAYLDGELLDGTPPQRTGVSPGTHSVRVSAPGRADVTREVTITAGQQSNVEVTEAQLVAARGRIVVRSNTPGARVFVDGGEVGAAPYEHDTSLGEHSIIVRAEGYTEASRSCTVTQTQPCEVAMTLDRVLAPGTVRVAALTSRGRPIANATVRLNDGPPRPLGDITGVPAGEARITVEAPNYSPTTQTIQVQSDQTAVVNATLQRTGPTGSDVARRRAGISTFGAAPLVRGDAAVDLIGSYGGMPLEARLTLGLVPFGTLGPFVVDGGVSIRSRFNWWEFELRSRAGVRVFNDTFAFGGEARFYGALGGGGSNGVGGLLQVNASAQFNLTSDESIDDEVGDANRVNRFGSFAITLNLGVEFNNDNASSSFNPNLTPPTGGDALTLCQNVDSTNERQPSGGSCTLSTTVRPFFGGVVEFGIARHLSAFAGLQYYLSAPGERVAGQTAAQIEDDNGSRRPITTSFWDDTIRAVLRGGITYKF